MMVQEIDPVDEIRRHFGEAVRVSDWLRVEQETIDRFAAATQDFDWIHTDPERARKESPFGGTIAFGFWTVSMLTYFLRQATGSPYPSGARYGMNYGFDRVRLAAPVPVGSRIRGSFRLVSVEGRGEGRYLVTTDSRVEVEGAEKPAMVAQWLIMLVY
jgi:acyl dehydratase